VKLESIEHMRDIIKGSAIPGRVSWELQEGLDAVEKEGVALVLMQEGNCQQAQAVPRQPLGVAS
jgi:hypothetical protein